jgi:hypothetical protein
MSTKEGLHGKSGFCHALLPGMVDGVIRMGQSGGGQGGRTQAYGKHGSARGDESPSLSLDVMHPWQIPVNALQRHVLTSFATTAALHYRPLGHALRHVIAEGRQGRRLP